MPAEAPEEEKEEPVHLELELPDGTKVSLVDPDGNELEPADEAELADVLAILEEAELKPGEPEEEAAGRLKFAFPGEEVVKIFIYRDFIKAGGSYYKLEPWKLEQLYSLFEPTEVEPVEIAGLVLVSDLDDSIIIDLQYATEDNFTGQVIYPVEVAAIYKETGKRLVEAQQIFKEKGYRIKLWDAYRPLSAQEMLWKAYPDPRYVHKPEDPAVYEE